MTKTNVYVRLDEETIKKIDFLISKHEYDTRSGFIRKAVYDKLFELEPKIQY